MSIYNWNIPTGPYIPDIFQLYSGGSLFGVPIRVLCFSLGFGALGEVSGSMEVELHRGLCREVLKRYWGLGDFDYSSHDVIAGLSFTVSILTHSGEVPVRPWSSVLLPRMQGLGFISRLQLVLLQA